MSDEIKFHRNASFLLATIGRRAEHEWNLMLRDEGITTAQFTAMAVLVDSESSHRGLATRMGIDPRNAGAVVRQLERKGWVSSQVDEADGRVRLLQVTEAGFDWWRSIQDGLASSRARFFTPLSAREVATLEKLLNRLDEHLVRR